MSNTSNEKKTATLGMPHGTAAHRLRKMVLFRLLTKHKENVCVRCGKMIEAMDDLSIEHLKPWEGISADLFWDLDNVAFSHRFCNLPHRKSPGNPSIKDFNPRKEVHGSRPDGTAWCIGHKAYLSIDSFHSNTRNPGGVASYCKSCRQERKD